MSNLMKGAGITVASFILIIAGGAGAAHAQGMMRGGDAGDDHTAAEEAQGKMVWEKLQAKQTDCAQLSDEDFAVLGEYFMGQMMGEAHAAMNQMMTQMMGEEGEEEMHVVMGKRLSGCDPTAAFSPQARGFMPMMQMMWGGWGGGTDAKGGEWVWPHAIGRGMHVIGWIAAVGAIISLAVWILAIIGLVYAIRWLIRKLRTGERPSAIAILEERYARGEISREEFEERRKTLGR